MTDERVWCVTVATAGVTDEVLSSTSTFVDEQTYAQVVKLVEAGKVEGISGVSGQEIVVGLDDAAKSLNAISGIVKM